MDNRQMNSLSIEWVSTPNGVARVPIQSGEKYVVLHTYDRFTKEYIVFKYDRNTGELVWTSYLPAGGYASPAIGDGVVFIPCGYSQICGLDENTGEKLWTIDLLSRNRSTPVYSDGLAYLGSGNRIFGISGKGEVVKEAKYPGNIFFGQPIIIDEVLYIVGDSNPTKNQSRQFITAINLNNMELIWQKDIGPGIMSSCDSAGLAFHENGMIFSGTIDGNLVAVDSNSGEIIWKVKGTGIASRSKPYVYKDSVYVSSLSGYILGADINGKEKFNVFLNDEGCWCPPIIYDDKLLVHSGVHLYLLSRENGSLIDQLAIGHSPYTNFEIASGKLYIAAGDPPDWFNLFCIRLTNNPRFSIKDVNIDYDIDDNQNIQFDNLSVTFSIGTADSMIPNEISVDLSVFGGTSTHKVEKINSQTYKFEIKIPKFNRFGDYAITAKAALANRTVVSTIPVCLRQFKPNDIPESFKIDNYKINIQQEDFYSGSAVMKSVFSYYGKEINQETVNSMGEYIDELGIDPHHKWRTGSVRMLHSSGNIRSGEEELDKKISFID